MRTRILLVEDDENFGELLKDYLELNGYTVQLAKDGNLGYAAIQNTSFDFCILDVMMPYKDGFSLAKELQAQKPDVPFLFLTAKSMKHDTINGFKLGAADYLCKPFDSEVLLYKIKAILGRADREPGLIEHFQDENIKYSHADRLLSLGGIETRLSPKEAAIFQYLINKPNQVIDRAELLNSIWEDDSYFNGRSMDVYMAKLRKLFKPHEFIDLITIHGKGFRLNLKE